MGASARNGTAPRGAAGTRCSVCRKHKEKVHRSRKTKKMVCAACSDRARMRVTRCTDCGKHKLIQARGRCYACYKRIWRSQRPSVLPGPRRSHARA
jgi:hypothetical protein